MIEIARLIITGLALIGIIIIAIRMRKLSKLLNENSGHVKRYLDYLEKELEEESKKVMKKINKEK